MNAPSHDEVDRVLRLKRKEREVRACYPCRKRKVKCDGTQPCRTCQKRNHPHICTYDLPSDSRKEAHPAVNIQSASPSPGRLQQSRRQNEFPAAPLANIPLANIPTSHRPDDTAKNYVYSGDNSVVSILRSRASDGNESMTQDLGSVLGLQNTFNNYPFMDSKTPQEKWKSLLSVLPQRSEVLKYD